MSEPSADPSSPEVDDDDDRVDQHTDEQLRRAEEEPKHEGPQDRTVATESSPGPDRTPPDTDTA